MNHDESRVDPVFFFFFFFCFLFFLIKIFHFFWFSWFFWSFLAHNLDKRENYPVVLWAWQEVAATEMKEKKGFVLCPRGENLFPFRQKSPSLIFSFFLFFSFLWAPHPRLLSCCTLLYVTLFVRANKRRRKKDFPLLATKLHKIHKSEAVHFHEGFHYP